MWPDPRREDVHEVVRSLPKVELHRHLEGSLRIGTLLELARRNGLPVPRAESALRAQIQVQPHDPLTWQNFLAKFEALRPFFQSPEVIARLVREVIEDLAADRVVYAEMRFTPAALAASRNFDLHDVMDWVLSAAQEAAESVGIRVGWIASVNRHEPVETAERVARAAADLRDRGVVGLDLAGNEVDYAMDPFLPLFREAAEDGLGISVHAGEWADGGGVYRAIEGLGAQRIAHGVRVMEDPRAVDLARERRVAFEVCLTSNVASGAVRSYSEHPFPRLIQAGLAVTLNSDDPSICGICLSDEYRVAMLHYGLSLDTLRALILTAVQSAFLPPGDRRQLEGRLEGELFATIT